MDYSINLVVKGYPNGLKTVRDYLSFVEKLLENEHLSELLDAVVIFENTNNDLELIETKLSKILHDKSTVKDKTIGDEEVDFDIDFDK